MPTGHFFHAHRFKLFLALILFCLTTVYFSAYHRQPDHTASITSSLSSLRIPSAPPSSFSKPSGPPSHTSGEDSHAAANAAAASALTRDPPLRIAVVESCSTHDEVVAAHVDAWGSVDNAELHLFQSNIDRFGSLAMIRTLPTSAHLVVRDWEELRDWPGSNPAFDIIVSTSCECLLFGNASQLFTDAPAAQLFCTAHNTEQWQWPWVIDHMSPHLAERRVTFLALSPHVADALAEGLTTWAEIRDAGTPMPPIALFPPVFSLPEAWRRTQTATLDIALQGDYSPERRNYTHVFDGLAAAQAALNASLPAHATPGASLHLHLIGHGAWKPELPSPKTFDITFDEDLDYKSFYTLLSGCTALLPAFASHKYLSIKASSSVAAAFVAGAPLIADEELRAAYRYVRDDDVWMRGEGESEADVVARVAKMGIEERRAKAEKVRAHAREIVERNRAAARAWAAEIRLGISEGRTANASRFV